MDADAPGEFLTREEAARLAGVAVVTIDRWLREPGAPTWRTFRRRVQIPRVEYAAWLAAQVKERRS
jgi:excisionase family DNA binding protein